jgi:hypothetical protein
MWRMFSQKFYEALDPTYLQKIKKLEEVLDRIEDYDFEYDRYYSFVKNFANNYMLPKELWEKTRNAYFSTEWENWKHYQFYFSNRVLTHYQTKHRSFFLKSLHFEDVCDSSFLSYPHWKLDHIFSIFTDKSWAPLPRPVIKKYKEMKALYDKIESVEDDSEKWFTTLLEAENDEFVKQNVEYRLGDDLTDRKLWKLYIEFLKEKDSQRLLHTYSKYCRFFLDDFEMQNEYQKAAEKYGSIEVSWKKPFDFEIYNEKAIENIFKSFPRVPYRNDLKVKISKDICHCKFTFENAAPQGFPFLPNLMKNIWDKSDEYLRQKLFMACKYFFSRHPVPICYYLRISDAEYEEPFEQHSLFISKEFDNTRLKNLWVTTKLRASDDSNPLALSSIIPKLYRCDASFLNIYGQNLTMNELKFLIGHGNVIEMEFTEVNISDENGKPVLIENVLQMTPKLNYLSFSPTICSSQTSQILSQIPFQNKFYFFQVGSIAINITEQDANFFAEFIQKNASPTCVLKFNFVNLEMDWERIILFELILNNKTGGRFNDKISLF